jgi:hypothetical protein
VTPQLTRYVDQRGQAGVEPDHHHRLNRGELKRGSNGGTSERLNSSAIALGLARRV